MPPTITERIADTITRGGYSASREQAQAIRDEYQMMISETHRLSRQVQDLKEGGGMLAEDYASCTWNNRLNQDRQWLLLSGYNQQNRVIEKTDVELYHDLMNYHYMFSPLVKGAIDIKTRYTFGLSFGITSEIPKNQKTIEAVMKDPKNLLALFGPQATLEADRELQKGGNLFLAIWHNMNPVQVRVWSSYEISNIIMDPDDADLPMFYTRSWLDADGVQKTKAYPSLFNDKYEGIVDDAGVKAEVDSEILVYHIAEGKGVKQKWALTPYTAALPWNRAYEGFLLDFAAIVQMIRKYSTMFTTKGGDAQISALDTQFSHEQHGHHRNQLGNTIIASEGNDFKVIDAGNSKIVGLSDSKAYLLQYCSAVGVPENMLTGNPETGNRASAQELTSNFLPVIEERQTIWAGAFKAIFSKILENDEFEVSFPPIRSQDALTYLESLNKTARNTDGSLSGLIRPVDLIKAIYESLDIKVPEDTDIDTMVVDLMGKVQTEAPQMAAALERLAAAAEKMKGSPTTCHD